MSKEIRKSFSGKTFGDIGDCISIIPIARALGSMSLYAENSVLCKPILREDRWNAIKPLMDHSECIECFEPYAGQEITHDMASFRDGSIEFGKSLAQLHADWVGVKISEEPWLTVEPDNAFKGKIIINRSTRHQNPLFDWRRVLEHYLPDVVFIGLEEEWIQLKNETGLSFPRVRTTDLLQAARMIEASKLYIGNQSACLNVAIALGKRFICEQSLYACDVVYKRDAAYVCDGGIENFKVKGYAPLTIPAIIPDREVPWDHSPPGSLWYLKSTDGVQFQDYTSRDLLKTVNRHEEKAGVKRSEKRDLADQMIERFPTWTCGGHQNWMHDQIKWIKQIVQDKQK